MKPKPKPKPKPPRTWKRWAVIGLGTGKIYGVYEDCDEASAKAPMHCRIARVTITEDTK